MSQGIAASRSTARAWVDLARAGNFPSVWSNVWAALALSGTPVGRWPGGSIIALAMIAGSLAYAGGTTLNDVADAEFDAARRPERAIPRGLVSRGTAGLVGGLELSAGVLLLVSAGASAFWGLALAVCVALYDWLHKKWAGSVILMAGCRVLLAMTVASLPGHHAGPPFVAWLAALFTYIVALTALARMEYRPGRAGLLAGRQIGRLLAFIPLVDAVALAAAGAWVPSLGSALAIPLGKLAQRLAAST
jgi:4-hydroxybenzoate polyprenyltransferase